MRSVRVLLLGLVIGAGVRGEEACASGLDAASAPDFPSIDISPYAASAPDFPSIDIRPWLAPDDSPLAAGRDASAASWDKAMREWGFARVTGHGVPPEEVDRLRQAALAFFDLPAERKRPFSSGGSYGPEGWTEIGIESVGRTATDAPGAKGAKAPPDLVENLVIRHKPPAHASELATRPKIPPHLYDPLMSYWDRMETILRSLHAMSARALGQPASVFEDAYRNTTANALRFAHYPAASAASTEGQVRYGAHTDYQGYTLLMQDPAVGGLEVFKPEEGSVAARGDGRWVPVPPGGLIVNAGDLMELWANGRWRSAMHRVSNEQLADRRLSLAFFTGPRHDATIAPLAKPGEELHFQPVLAGEHLHKKLSVSNI
jgi:isopenicillin N synthase-like dioxygenase